MATFSIIVDVSPLATAIELYYTHIKPDGTTSSPAQKYTGVGIGGFIALPATPHPPGYTYTINNVVLNNNTVYNFEVKQFCVDNTIEYSPIDEDHYDTVCIDLFLQVGGFNYQNEEYPIVATWAPGIAGFDPNDYSVQDYTLTVEYLNGGNTITDIITIPSVPATIPGSSYVYNIESDDLTYPLAFGENYFVSLSFTLILGTGSTIEVNCTAKSIQLPYLRTYKIYGREGWIVDWIDENNIHQRMCRLTGGGTNFTPNPIVCETGWILIYHRTNPGPQGATNPLYPICGYCIGSSGAGFAGPYKAMYLPSPTIYNSDRVDCYPVNAGTGSAPNTGVPCNCGDFGTNNFLPSWGATWQLVGDGYVIIPGVTTITSDNVNSVCSGAPNW
jgi:hypothetical protein